MLARIAYFLCLLATTIHGYCPSKTYYASTYQAYIYHNYYTSNEDCTFTIVPSNFIGKWWDSHRQNDYYLELSWQSFDVRGDMPNCENDYVEIFLTRSEKSIGKFCSKNLIGSNLFNMYSYDGYAKIKFHSDKNENGNGFMVGYRLRSKSSDSLSGNDDCSSSYMFLSSESFYTAQWPDKYEKDGTCSYSISSSGTKKIVFMDMDLRKPLFFCNKATDDYIDIRGAGSSGTGFDKATALKGPICATSKVVTYTTSYDIVYVKLEKQDESSNNRGFVAGYVTYNAKVFSQGVSVGVIVAVTVGVIVLILVILPIVCCICKRNQRKLQQRQPIYPVSQGATTMGYGNVHQNSALPPEYPAMPSSGYPAVPPYSGANDMPPPYSEAVSTPYQTAMTQGSTVPGYQAPPPVNPSHH